MTGTTKKIKFREKWYSPPLGKKVLPRWIVPEQPNKSMSSTTTMASNNIVERSEE